MITVTLDQTGDTAEAETPEAAVFAALTLMRDDLDHNRIYARHRDLTVTFVVDGKRVRQANYQTLLSA
jgi:hypothetical protein